MNASCARKRSGNYGRRNVSEQLIEQCYHFVAMVFWFGLFWAAFNQNMVSKTVNERAGSCLLMLAFFGMAVCEIVLFSSSLGNA